MSENTDTAEPSPLCALMADVLQRARALLETNQNANDGVDLSGSPENEAPANDHPVNDDPAVASRELVSSDEDEQFVAHLYAPPHPRNYCGIKYPIGFYDPFNNTFPRNGLDQEWAERAVEFLLGEARVPLNSVINTICDPVLHDEWEWERTLEWFLALPLDVRAEVYLQRNFDLRPGSLWIMAPHDDKLPGWDWRYESRRCVIPGVEFRGMGLAYSICCGRRGAGNGLPDWCSDPATTMINHRRFNRRRVRTLL